MNIDLSQMKNVVIAGVIGFVAGFLLSSSLGGAGSGDLGRETENSGAETGSANGYFPAIDEVKVLSGIVKKISRDMVEFEVPVPPNYSGEWPVRREAVVTDATKIIKILSRGPAEIQKEMELYQKKIAEAKGDLSVISAPPLPSPYTEKIINLSDLKIGDQISVEGDKNIKSETRFNATRIIVRTDGAPQNMPVVSPNTLLPPSSPPASKFPPPVGSPTPADIGPTLLQD